MNKQPHVTRLKSDPGYDRDEYETPPEPFKKLDECFKFEFDAAASSDNTLCSKYFSKDGEDALYSGERWQIGKSIFCNPPFSKKDAFLELATVYRNCNVVTVFVLPNNARSTDWWNEYITLHADMVINLVPRVQYLIDGKRPQRFDKKIKKWVDSGVAFDSCVVVYYPRIYGIEYGLPKEVYWNWKE